MRLRVLVCCLVLGKLVVAQEAHHDRLKELLRVKQLITDTTTGNSGSFSVNPNIIDLLTIDSILKTKPAGTFRKKNVVGGLLPLQFTQQYQSTLPFEWNGGSLLPSKGYQALISLGGYINIGKRIKIQIAPELNSAENLNYEGFPLQLNDRAWADRYKFWNTVDIPQQYGTGSQITLYPGQSFIKYETKQFSFGISTQNLWWGPGYRNALIMSSNAPGFLHWSIETNKPIKTRIGNFEAQIIGGKLESSNILPPRINSVYNGSFVYSPKLEQERYMTGMVLTWNPKWINGLYVGIAKASYLYQQDISNPIDVLPLQGFFGRARTASERNGKKASMGSLFFRYVLPKDKAEIYMEYGRKDISLMPWNIIQTEGYRRAYVAGFRKLFETRNKAHIQFLTEFTQMQAPTAELIRNPDSWYTHQYVRQGYTNRGRSIGAGIGPGSNSQSAEISWIKGVKRIGVQFERIRYNSDYYYFAFEYIPDYRRHWIDLATTVKVDWPIGKLYLSGQAGLVRSYNYQWLVIQVDPNDLFAEGNGYLNFTGRLQLLYRF